MGCPSLARYDNSFFLLFLFDCGRMLEILGSTCWSIRFFFSNTLVFCALSCMEEVNGFWRGGTGGGGGHGARL